MKKELKKLKNNKYFLRDKENVEKLYEEFQEAFDNLSKKYPLENYEIIMTYGGISFNYIPIYKVNIRYGYDEMYPSEEYIIKNDNIWHKSQIGTAYLDDKRFFPDCGHIEEFEYGEEFEIKHDIIVGLSVYITITQIN